MSALPLPRPHYEPVDHGCPNCGDVHTLADVCSSCGLCSRCDEMPDDCACSSPAEERFEQALGAAY